MTKVDYNKVERDEAKRDGATLVHNSGRGLFKGDSKLGDFLVDYKYSGKSFTLNTKKWAKLVSDAFQNGRRRPAFKLIFETPGAPIRLWVIDDYSMKEYLELLEEKNG